MSHYPTFLTQTATVMPENLGMNPKAGFGNISRAGIALRHSPTLLRTWDNFQ
jgi:hypothetical protein